MQIKIIYGFQGKKACAFSNGMQHKRYFMQLKFLTSIVFVTL